MKNKEKYDIRYLTFNVNQTLNGIIKSIDIYHNVERIEKIKFLNETAATQAMNAIGNWLEEENVPDILTDKEKAYLSAVIKPYRQNVTGIKKGNIQGYSQEWITIEYSDETSKTYGYRIATLPNFKFGTMYKGMEANKVYTLKELGL